MPDSRDLGSGHDVLSAFYCAQGASRLNRARRIFLLFSLLSHHLRCLFSSSSEHLQYKYLGLYHRIKG